MFIIQINIILLILFLHYSYSQELNFTSGIRWIKIEEILDNHVQIKPIYIQTLSHRNFKIGFYSNIF